MSVFLRLGKFSRRVGFPAHHNANGVGAKTFSGSLKDCFNGMIFWWVEDPPYNKALRLCGGQGCPPYEIYSTVTDFAKFLGLSTSVPSASAV